MVRVGVHNFNTCKFPPCFYFTLLFEKGTAEKGQMKKNVKLLPRMGQQVFNHNHLLRETYFKWYNKQKTKVQFTGEYVNPV